jgi:YVTN family beta-propeller protein
MKRIISGLTRAAAAFVLISLTGSEASAQYRVYVANRGSNDVSVIDTGGNTVISTIPVGDLPSAAVVTRDGARAYILNSGSGTVSVIDTALDAVVATIEVGAAPEGIAITPDGGLVYVSHPGLDLISVIETAGHTLVTSMAIASYPHAIAITPDGQLAFVAHYGESYDAVSVISTATNTVVATVGLPWFIPGLASITISPDGAFVYVNNRFFWRVYVIDTAYYEVVGSVGRGGGGSIGGGFQGTPAMTPDGGSIYLPNFYGSAMEVFSAFSTEDPALPQVIPMTSRPEAVAVTPDGAFAYATGSLIFTPTGDDVTVIDTATRAVITRIAVGSSPAALAMTSRVSAIPGRIQAEDYDVGGQDRGYFDSTAGNEQGVAVYRSDDVDIKLSGEGGYAAGWFTAGEWLAYTANVAIEGLYTIQVRVGSALPGRTFHIEVGGGDVTGPVPVPQLADWDRYETASIADVPLAAGRHVVRLVMGPEDHMDLQWIAFVLQTTDAPPGPFAGTPGAIPGRIQAEDYDLGGQGHGYFDTTPANEQGFTVYRSDDVDIKWSSEGGHAVGWLVAGEWLAYTVDVEREDLYRIHVRVGSPLPGRSFHIEADGVDVTGPIAVPHVADWDRYETVTVDDVPLPAGNPVLRVVMGPEDYADFQWFTIGG